MPLTILRLAGGPPFDGNLQSLKSSNKMMIDKCSFVLGSRTSHFSIRWIKMIYARVYKEL